MNLHMVAVLQSTSWHNGGLFMGMHWLWWLVWVGTVGVLGWAFVRLYADRAQVRRRVGEEEAAELVLRKRFAQGDIDEDQYIKKVKVLRETTLG